MEGQDTGKRKLMYQPGLDDAGGSKSNFLDQNWHGEGSSFSNVCCSKISGSRSSSSSCISNYGPESACISSSSSSSAIPHPPPLMEEPLKSPHINLMPDAVLVRVLQFLRNVGKVCKKWENIKVLVLRSRSVESFQKTKLPEDLCREIENQLFVFSSNSVNAQYKKVMRMLIFNLKEGKNPSIRDKVLNRLLPPCHVVRLTPQDFLSPEELEHRKNVGEQHLKDITIQETVIESHAFTCPK